MGRESRTLTISVVAALCGVHPQTLRSYERWGLVEPARTAANVRLYSASDVERLQRIHRLTTELGINLAGVAAILHLREQVLQLQREVDRLRQP